MAQQEWMQMLRLPEIWQYYTGRNVGVAILDTGITEITDVPYNANTYLDIKCTDIKDDVGHGTHCAGIVGARNNAGNYVGVAPGCELYICKICNSDNLGNINTAGIEYANAIEWCANQADIKILSISWSSFINTKNKELIASIQKSIDKAVSRNKIVIAARGNIDYTKDSSLTYPACLNNVISVGIVPEGNSQNFWGHKSILVPGANIISYDTQGFLIEKSGTSMSTAIMAGIIALMAEKDSNIDYNSISGSIPSISCLHNIDGENVNIINGNLLYNFLTDQNPVS